jgi:hypothetical protein
MVHALGDPRKYAASPVHASAGSGGGAMAERRWPGGRKPEPGEAVVVHFSNGPFWGRALASAEDAAAAGAAQSGGAVEGSGTIGVAAAPAVEGEQPRSVSPLPSSKHHAASFTGSSPRPSLGCVMLFAKSSSVMTASLRVDCCESSACFVGGFLGAEEVSDDVTRFQSP